ncbi:MAG TPA: cupredoxin domain-containing protein [Thermoanaerobaculia bacterium]
MKRIALIALMATALLSITLLSVAQETTPRVVEITAKRFEFNPKQITLKRGERVTIRVVSTDRAHGFLVKPLGLDLDADLGKPSEKTITPDTAGTFPAICDHYCGSGHGNMKMTVIVE